MKSINYKDYFTRHYKYSLSEQDVVTFEKWFMPQWKKIKQHVKLKNNMDILEIGTGVGGFYSILKKQGNFNYVGIELDTKAVSFSNKYFSTSSFQVTSIEEMSTKRKFDCIFSFEVLEHLQNPIGALEKIHSLLKPGGVFIGTSPFPFKKNIVGDETHLFVLHPNNWKRLFQLTGFIKIEMYPMSFPPYIWRITSVLHMYIPFYISLRGFVSTTLFIVRKNKHV